MATMLAVWWNREVVDFVTAEQAEQLLNKQPDSIRKIKVKGTDGKEREALLVTTPQIRWRTIIG